MSEVKPGQVWLTADGRRRQIRRGRVVDGSYQFEVQLIDERAGAMWVPEWYVIDNWTLRAPVRSAQQWMKYDGRLGMWAGYILGPGWEQPGHVGFYTHSWIEDGKPHVEVVEIGDAPGGGFQVVSRKEVSP